MVHPSHGRAGRVIIVLWHSMSHCYQVESEQMPEPSLLECIKQRRSLVLRLVQHVAANVSSSLEFSDTSLTRWARDCPIIGFYSDWES